MRSFTHCTTSWFSLIIPFPLLTSLDQGLLAPSGYPLRHHHFSHHPSPPTPTPAYKHCEYHAFEYLHVEPETQHVGPVYPVPPHWPHLAAQPEPPPVPLVGVLPPAEVVGVLPPPPDELDSCVLTKASACWPYLLPYCWCELASLPVQQYGSVESQYDFILLAELEPQT